MRFLLFFLFFPVCFFSQKGIQISEHAKMTYSKFDHAFYVFDDSTSYLKYNLKKQNWQKRPVYFELENTWTFQEFIRRFHPVAVSKNQLFFVLDGCGEVYEFKNDTIKRLDNSFDHKNQFGSAMYQYQNKVFMFGGYGLFRLKTFIHILIRKPKNGMKCMPMESKSPRQEVHHILFKQMLLFIFLEAPIRM